MYTPLTLQSPKATLHIPSSQMEKFVLLSAQGSKCKFSFFELHQVKGKKGVKEGKEFELSGREYFLNNLFAIAPITNIRLFRIS